MSNYELKKKLVRDMDEYVKNISDENAWLWWIEDERDAYYENCDFNYEEVTKEEYMENCEE